jgi:hypothetical protein
MAATKTVADLANARLLANDASFPHRMDLVSESPVKATALSPTAVVGPDSLPISPLRQHPMHRHPRPVKNWDVYMDAFIGAVQGKINHRIQCFVRSTSRMDPTIKTRFCQEDAEGRRNLGHSQGGYGVDD